MRVEKFLSACPRCFFYHAAVSRFYKHWYKSKKKAFTRYAKKFAEAPQEIESELKRIKDHAQVVRVIAHTQVQSMQMASNLNRGNGKSKEKLLK